MAENVYTWGNNRLLPIIGGGGGFQLGKLGINSPELQLNSPQLLFSNTGFINAFPSKTNLYHSLSIKNPNGTLWAWGDNTYGQLGDGTNTARFLPVQINGTWLDVSVGWYHSLAIKSNGTLWAWGQNTYGKLGDGTTINKNVPTQIGTDTWNYISAGRDHSIGIKSDGTLWTWGRNEFGQLGNNSQTNYSVPIKISNDSWIKISAGFGHSFAIKSDYTLWAWGNNQYAQLGDNIAGNKLIPTQIPGLWWSVSAGYFSTIALKNDGTLWAWGNNTYGQLGNGTGLDSPVPIQIPIPGSFFYISAGFDHCFAIKNDYTLWAWGGNSKGQLGDQTELNKLSPIQIPGDWRHVNAGYESSIAIGQTLISSPAAMSPSNAFAIVGIANTYGQAGIGSSTLSTSANSSNTPELIGVKLPPVAITDIAHSNNHTLFISNNNVWACGRNVYGQLGNNSTSTELTPIQITSSNNITKIAAGNECSFAINSIGELYSWGYNANGRLGLGDLNDRLIPTRVGVDSNWSDIKCVNSHAIALKTDGSIWAWGLNTTGQLGQGDTTQRTSPTRIGTDNNWIAIASSDTAIFALNDQGQVFSCGNSSCIGRTGTNTVLGQISGLSNITKIFTCQGTVGAALDNQNRLYTWGLNTNGSLGVGSYVAKTTPTLVSGSWKDYSASNNAALAISTSDEVFVTGRTTYNTDTGAYATPTSSNVLVKLNNISGVTKVVIGNAVAFICTVANQKLLYSYARQYYGAAGESYTSTFIPTPFPTSAINNVRSFAVAKSRLNPDSNFKILIDENNNIYGWGDNDHNFLSEFWGVWGAYLGIDYNYTRTLSKLSSSIDSWQEGRLWKKVSMGQDFAVFLAEDGKLIPIGGNNVYGEIGYGALGPNYPSTTYGSFTSANLGINTLFNDVACGLNHSIAIGANNRLYAWGRNHVGQLGFGNTSGSSGGAGPTLLPTTTQFSKVFCGDNHSVALNSNGLWAWGDNTYGQVTTNDPFITSPLQVIAGQVTDVACGSNHTVVIMLNGQLWGCGLNNLGQIGQSSGSSFSSFVRIGSASNWARVFAFGNNTVAINTLGEIYVFGANNYGQVGIGSNTPSLIRTPTLLASLKSPNPTLSTAIFDGTERAVFGLGVANDTIPATTTTTTTTGQPGTTTTTTTGQPGTTTTTTTTQPGQTTTTTTTTPAPSFIAGKNTVNGNNIAIWNNSETYSLQYDGNFTTIGANGGSSYYGTHDQEGNTREWTDTIQGGTKILRGSRTWDETIGKNKRWENVTPEGSSILNGDYIGYGVGARIASSNNPLNLHNFVSVINSGNSIDTTGFGKVDYNYQIGKYEVSNTEYVEFLNAIASIGDTYNVFPTGMTPESSGLFGGINASTNVFANPPTTTYSVKPYFEEKPANGINWFGFARYCNWLHNGKPVGVQGPLTTESGSYILLGARSGIFNKTPNAKYWIPTEDEWYKAAYYNGSGNYYTTYATQSNEQPAYVESDQYGRAIFDIPNASTKTVKVYSNNVDWTDSRIDIQNNSLFAIDASGSFSSMGLNSINPNGIDLVFTNPNLINRKLTNAKQFYNGALIGKIGINGTPFLIGKYLLPKLSQGGRLYLAINDNNLAANNEGFFTVTIRTELGVPCKPAKDYRRIQLRRGSELDFVNNYTVLASGEPAYAFDTGTLKIGDGTNQWIDLPVLAQTSPNGPTEESIYEIVKNILQSGSRTTVVIDDQNKKISYNSSVEPQVFEITALNITSNQNNFNLGNKAVSRLVSTAGVQLTGFVAGSPGEMKLIYNAGSFNISILHNSSSSSVGNRVLTSNSSTYVLPPNNGVSILYDNINGAWRLF